MRAALEVAVDRVGDFHRHQLAETAHPATYERDGVTVRTEFRAVERAACYVPGGRAVYPSTVLHTAVPARIAGVDEVVLCVPPDDTGHVPAVTLAAAALAGVDEVYRIGGAQAIAALAYGTASIRPVDVIVGPGNIYVALAKRAVADVCGVPTAFAGPSEVVVVADATAPVELRRRRRARPGRARSARPGVAGLLGRGRRRRRHGRGRPTGGRGPAARRDRGHPGVERLRRAVRLARAGHGREQRGRSRAPRADQRRPRGARAPGAPRRVRCSAARATPASLGDYLAGPSHVLPTHGSARFGQALTVRDFLKQVHVVTATPAGMAALAPHLEALAAAEGLLAHAESATRRR